MGPDDPQVALYAGPIPALDMEEDTLSIGGTFSMDNTYQSPQSVMSSTSCCGVKNSVILQELDAGKLAEGGPHCEMSIDDVLVPCVIDGGTFDRCQDLDKFIERTYIIISLTLQNHMLSRVQGAVRYHFEGQ